MSEHSCVFCRAARELNIAQIDRFTASGKTPEAFLNDPEEDQKSSDMIYLMVQHDKIKSAELRIPRI